MDKLFEKLAELGVTALIPTKKGVVIPASVVWDKRLVVADLNALCDETIEVREMKDKYKEDDPCKSFFVGTPRVPKDSKAVVADAKAHMQKLVK
tara:strand:+ start:880 stop:1161 length:282 start_codon:yes stop_codon:yes gene_type:complete